MNSADGMTSGPAGPRHLVSLEDINIALAVSGRAMVHDVGLSVEPGEIFGLAGESGSGKTMLVKTVFGLHDDAVLVSGNITYKGQAFGPERHQQRIRKLLGHEIGFVPQDPFSSLNPTMRVGFQIAEAIKLGKGIPPGSARSRNMVSELLSEVGIPSPEIAARQYPDQFSGGMRQRIVLAIALSQEPGLLIADEPTTALDAHTQGMIIKLIIDRSKYRNLAVILISHNLELLRRNVSRVAVMYGGQLLNILSSAELGGGDGHPYTEALFKCIPRRDTRLQDIRSIPGEPVGAGFGMIGCSFESRCSLRQDFCRTSRIPTNSGRDPDFDACLLRARR